MNNKNEEKIQQDMLQQSLKQQLEEFEMMSAIFCSPGELQVDDYTCIENITSFIKGESMSLNQKLDYRLNLPSLRGEKVQILVEVPHLYPAIEIPRVVIRSSAIPREQERMLTKRIEMYINEEVIERGEPYVYQVVSWIQDNLEELLKTTAEKRDPEGNRTPTKTPVSPEGKSKEVFERLWIYSHHLKSKGKRQTIVHTARDLGLTGFSRPGKPAIICVEGWQSDTQMFWKTIKPLKWQKIQIKLCETSAVVPGSNINDLCHFNAGFREELFCEADDLDPNAEDSPMSMSLFMKFLEKHSCSYIKKDLFGFHTLNDPSPS